MFKLWKQHGIAGDTEKIFIFIRFIEETKDTTEEELIETLQEYQIKPETTMPTLAERYRVEGREQGLEQGLEQLLRESGQ